MSHKFERLEREDVVSVYSGQIFINNRTFTVSEFITAFLPIVKEKSTPWTEEKERWLTEGLECKTLKPGAKSWQRGKVRITLEFCSEELDVAETADNGELPASKANSPLEDLRQRIPKDN